MARGATDMRKSFDTLSALVCDVIDEDPHRRRPAQHAERASTSRRISASASPCGTSRAMPFVSRIDIGPAISGSGRNRTGTRSAPLLFADRFFPPSSFAAQYCSLEYETPSCFSWKAAWG